MKRQERIQEKIQERALRVTELLDEYIPHPEVPLNHSDPFTLLVAVCLSAQCTDERVNQVTPALFALASDPQAMAALDAEVIEAIIRPCGLSKSKSVRLKKMAGEILERHGGRVPSDLVSLEALSGVGHKTACVVQVQAFSLPAFPVDTHILRSAQRWGLSKARDVEGVEADLEKLFDSSLWGRVHLQMILFARSYCPAKAHNLEKCPICSELGCLSIPLKNP